MDSVLRSVAVYLFVLVVFRISGKRSLSQITTFDFILLLIIGEATQQALLGDDFSIVNAFVVIATLIDARDRVLVDGAAHARRSAASWKACRSSSWRTASCCVNEREQEGVTLAEILAAGREHHGLERLEQFKYAILERHGGISVVPTEDAR